MMISPQSFFHVLERMGVTFISGVPDSLLKDFCAFLEAFVPPDRHVIAVNEGSAVGLASGHFLASGRLPMVYLQNSGLGNAINPLLSLADPEVYGLPLVAMIGWRGEPGVKDEPQHVKQGRVTPSLLEAMEVPYRVLDGDEDQAAEIAKWACESALKRSGPVAILVRDGVFNRAANKKHRPFSDTGMMIREAAISLVISAIYSESTIIATTGMISRELHELRVRDKQPRCHDFLTVGSMGHASQIALGVCIARPNANVVCLDGDGAALMHLGGMATIGASPIGNLLHIVLNNGAHDSVGGQPTVGFDVSLTGVAKACGYNEVVGPLTREEEISEAIRYLTLMKGRRFLELRVDKGSRSDLGRPKDSPAQNKVVFSAKLAEAPLNLDWS